MRPRTLAPLLLLGALPLAACGSGASQVAQTVTVSVESVTTLPAPTAVVTQTWTPPPPSTVTVTVPPAASTTTPAEAPTTSSADPSPAASGCASTSARQARDENVANVPAEPGTTWDTTTSVGLEGYDPCKALSWVVLGVKGATASSPYSVMMFHEGKYIGRASAVNFGFWPAVRRVDASTIVITYTYAKQGEANGMASGRATSTFVWDSAQQKVVQSGQWPPH